LLLSNTDLAVEGAVAATVAEMETAVVAAGMLVAVAAILVDERLPTVMKFPMNEKSSFEERQALRDKRTERDASSLAR
jgi:hypothetical protein